ncbi:hypothetical protein [Emticicia sp. 17c]|uniref:hypothetical protein n=1 Tax=Emticicia sp. 17c TaxID=3127704 RepID=UPI00301CA043
MKTSVINVLRICHYLSLDVVIGAVASSWMFWQMPDGQSSPNSATLLILGISTWIVYVFDRLLDNLKATPNDVRHEFYFRHQYYLQVLLIILFFIALALILFLPYPVRWFGAFFSVLLIGYFWLLHKKPADSAYHYYKEILTAVLYALPVFGSAFAMKQHLGLGAYIAALNFVGLVHQSILVFSVYESNENPNAKNLARKIGSTNSRIWVVCIMLWMGISYLLADTPYLKQVFFVEWLMALASMLIVFLPAYLSVNQRYRWLGEMVFWLPLCLIFF